MFWFLFELNKGNVWRINFTTSCRKALKCAHTAMRFLFFRRIYILRKKRIPPTTKSILPQEQNFAITFIDFYYTSVQRRRQGRFPIGSGYLRTRLVRRNNLVHLPERLRSPRLRRHNLVLSACAASHPMRSVPDWMRVSSNPACSEVKPYPAARAASHPFNPSNPCTDWPAQKRLGTQFPDEPHFRRVWQLSPVQVWVQVLGLCHPVFRRCCRECSVRCLAIRPMAMQLELLQRWKAVRRFNAPFLSAVWANRLTGWSLAATSEELSTTPSGFPLPSDRRVLQVPLAMATDFN